MNPMPYSGILQLSYFEEVMQPYFDAKIGCEYADILFFKCNDRRMDAWCVLLRRPRGIKVIKKKKKGRVTAVKAVTFTSFE